MSLSTELGMSRGHVLLSPYSTLLDEGEAGGLIEEGATVLFHGTGETSAADILENGISMNKASELGGGDQFWTTTSQEDAGWFAKANPAGENPVTLQITVPNSVINNLGSSVTISGPVYTFSPEAIDTLNSAATIKVVP